MMSSLSLLLLFLCCASVAPYVLEVYNMRASGLRNDPVGPADGYVKVYYGSSVFGTTSVRWNTANPYWTEKFAKTSASSGGKLVVKVLDRDTAFDDTLGTCSFKISRGSHSESCSLGKGRMYFTYRLS